VRDWLPRPWFEEGQCRMPRYRRARHDAQTRAYVCAQHFDGGRPRELAWRAHPSRSATRLHRRRGRGRLMRLPRAECVVLARANELLVGELFHAGATGFLLKSDTNLHLIAAIEIVSPYIFAPSFLGLEHAVPLGRGTREPITGRHHQVAQSIADGYTNKRNRRYFQRRPQTVATSRATSPADRTQ